jgi:hypothetical protein
MGMRRSRKAYQSGPTALYKSGAQLSQGAAYALQTTISADSRSSTLSSMGSATCLCGNVGGVGSPLTLPGLFLNCRLQLDRVLNRSFESLSSLDTALGSKMVVDE